MSNGAYRVLLAIFNYTNKSGENGHPGEQRLADDTGLSPRSVRDYLKWLTDQGYLIKGPRGHGNGGQGHGFATVYALGMPDLPAESRRLVDSDEEPTGEISPPTGEISPTYRQDCVDLPAKSRPLSDPLSDPQSDPSTSNPGADDPYCQHCEDSAYNVCGLHFHDRKHRWRDPSGDGQGQNIQPVSRPSRPNTLGNNAQRCSIEGCDDRPLSTGMHCAKHAFLKPLASV